MDGTRFMRQVDSPSETKLPHLISLIGVSHATIIRRLLMQATPEDVPPSWQRRAAEHSLPSVQQPTKNRREMTR
jgi:hypothetical protein